MLDLSSSDPRSSRNRTQNALACKHSPGTRLEELIDQHIATLHATADPVHASEDVLMREEAENRQSILRYCPQTASEANEKLTYVAAYILKAGNVLTRE